MSFVKSYYVQTADEMINGAFSSARMKAQGISAPDKQSLIRQKERARIKYAAEYISEAFTKVVTRFPALSKVNPFYKLMLENVMDVGTLRKALGHVNVAISIVDNLKMDYTVLVAKRPSSLSGETRNQFYGRLKSVVKKTNTSLKTIAEGYKLMSDIPYIREDLAASVIIGLPNVGKSTFLKNITGAKVEIQNYPFTTKKLQLGTITHKYINIQIVDSPGLLDRDEKDQNAIEKQTVLALKNISTSNIFMVDLTQDIKPQLNVVNRYVSAKVPFIIIFNKKDLVLKQERAEFKEEFINGLKLKTKDDIITFEIDQKITPDEIENIKDIVYKQNKSFYTK